MRISTIIFCFVLCFRVYSQNAQEAITRKMINPTSVTLISNPFNKINGALYQVKDASILISHSTWLKDYTMGNSNYTITEIEVKDIQMIKTLSKTRSRRGALIGAASGFVVMGGIAMILNDIEGGSGYFSFPNWQVGLANGIIFAPVGAFVGAIIGSINIRIPINGSLSNYHRNKAILTKYSLMK
jgi:hypothetical protein